MRHAIGAILFFNCLRTFRGLGPCLCMLVFVISACGERNNSPSKAERSHEWKRYCNQDLQFSLRYPPEMQPNASSPKVTAEGKFNVIEWRVPGSEWFVVVNLHKLPKISTQPLKDWLADWGGNLEPIKLQDNVPAALRTSLFEAIFEKSVFFREKSGHRAVEIRLVVRNIADWMGPPEKIELQYRNQERIFDSMVKSIRLGDCPTKQ